MGFWKSFFGGFGKVVGKTALTIAMPGAVAGYEYQKQKAIGEAMAEFDETMDTLFKHLAAFDERDGWSELLVIVRNIVVNCLTNKKTRDKVLSETHPNERARACCEMALGATESDALLHIAQEKNVDLNLLKGVLTMQLLLCEQLDKCLSETGTVGMEENVMRLLFDMVCTRLPIVSAKISARNNNDVNKVFQEVLSMMFSEEDNEIPHVCKLLCEENKVSYGALKDRYGKYL